MVDFAVGAALSAFISYLFYRSLRVASLERLSATEKELQDKSQRLEILDCDLRTALDAKARAEQELQRIPELQEQVAGLRRENSELTEQVTELKKGRESDEEKVRWLERAQGHLREAFQSLASQVLQSNAEEFLRRAREQVDSLLSQARGDWKNQRREIQELVKPLEGTLEMLDSQVRELEQKREGTYQESQEKFLKRANDQLDNLLNQARGDWKNQRREIQELVKPLEGTLETLDSQVRELEQKREGAYQGLQEQLGRIGETHQQLQITTATLARALKAPGVRGRWGEVQLRRVVEMAGMMEHVDFNGQAADAGRPDMFVHLPNKGILPVDTKTSMQAYLEAMEASDDQHRKAKLDAYSRELRQRILELGERRYWQQFEHTPELVAMFMPNDACLGIAFESDPELLEYAMQQRVLLTSPVTLLALLKAVAYGWQQHQVLENARQITVQGGQLYERLVSFLNHLNVLGRRLDLAVRDYNKAVGSLESRVFPSARRLKEMGVTSMVLPSAAGIECQPRRPASPDLDEEVEDESCPGERKEEI